MKINVAEALKQPGQTFSVSLEECFGKQDFGGRVIEFAQPVHVDMQYTFDDSGCSASGTVTTALRSTCARCLTEFDEPMRIPFDERFMRVRQADDEESYLFEGDVLELDALVLDNLFLHIPIQSLCKEDCLGLCPVCGANLNTTACDCANNKVQTGTLYSALEKFLNESKEV